MRCGVRQGGWGSWRLLSVLLLAVAAASPQTETPATPGRWDEFDRSERIAGGINYRERRFYRGAEGPFTMQILAVDPEDPRINLLLVRGNDRLNSKETVASMAHRYGAAAAVNGGYFVVTGPYAGASAGAWQFHRRPLYAGSGRSGLVFCEENGFVEQVEIGLIAFQGQVRAPSGAMFGISGMNRERAAGELILYLSEFGAGTLTGGGGVEAALDPGRRVIRVAETGNLSIPPGGLVLSGSGEAAEWLREHAALGEALEVEVQLIPQPPGCPAEDILSAGPRIVRGGAVAVADESFAHAAVRHPRTAVALAEDGKILFVTVDGRQAASVGMRLDELAAELVSLGAREAINLDGGGSTTMYAGGRVRNSPSDPRERPVSDGILVFSIGTRQEIARLLEQLSAGAGHIDPEILPRLREKLDADLSAFRALVDACEGNGLSHAAARLLREGAFAASLPLP